VTGLPAVLGDTTGCVGRGGSVFGFTNPELLDWLDAVGQSGENAKQLTLRCIQSLRQEASDGHQRSKMAVFEALVTGSCLHAQPHCSNLCTKLVSSVSTSRARMYEVGCTRHPFGAHDRG
jgi:hypothetical protein